MKKLLLIICLLFAVGCSTTQDPTPIDCNAAQTTYNALCAQGATWAIRFKSAQAAHNNEAIERYGDSIVAVYRRRLAFKERADSLGCEIISCE